MRRATEFAERRIDEGNLCYRDQQRDDENYGEDPHEIGFYNRGQRATRRRFRPALPHRSALENEPMVSTRSCAAPLAGAPRGPARAGRPRSTGCA